MKIYYYSKCSTCQRALLFLKERRVDFIAIDIKEQPPSMEELKKMAEITQGNFKRLFNTSGMLYRELQLKEKLSTISLEDALLLLHHNGMLIKRPFFLTEKGGVLGFKEDEWKKLV